MPSTYYAADTARTAEIVLAAQAAAARDEQPYCVACQHEHHGPVAMHAAGTCRRAVRITITR